MKYIEEKIIDIINNWGFKKVEDKHWCKYITSTNVVHMHFNNYLIIEYVIYSGQQRISNKEIIHFGELSWIKYFENFIKQKIINIIIDTYDKKIFIK